MNRLVGFLPGKSSAAPTSNARRAADSLGRIRPSERTVEGDLAFAWLPSETLAVARSDGVVCAVAGPARLRGQLVGDDVAVTLAADYARNGEVHLDQLRGTFALLLWNADRKRGLLAVDQLGAMSIVYRQTGASLLFSLELIDLLPLLERRPVPNDRAAVQWLAGGTVEPNETLYDGVQRLEASHCLEFARESFTKRRYWRFDYVPPERMPPGELEQQLRETIRRAVDAPLASETGSGVLLSGGLDSAVVAAEAARLRPNRVHAYSLVFPEHPEVDEQAFVEQVVAELGLPSTLVAYRGGGILTASLDYLREWSAPAVSPNLAVQRPLLEAASNDGATLLIDGQGGDELFGASLYALADFVRSGRLLRAKTLSGRIPGIPARQRSRATRRALYEFALKGSLPHGAHTISRRIRQTMRAPGPPWLSQASAQTYAETLDPWRWTQARGPRGWSSMLDGLTSQRERAGAHEYLRRRNAMAGVRGAHPFLQDLDLISLLLRIPPELAFDARFDRPLLRSAVEGLVPDPVRLRADKSFFTPLFVEAVQKHDRLAIDELLTDKNAATRAYTRPEIVRERLLRAPAAHQGGAWAWALWRLVTLECWLRGESR